MVIVMIIISIMKNIISKLVTHRNYKLTRIIRPLQLPISSYLLRTSFPFSTSQPPSPSQSSSLSTSSSTTTSTTTARKSDSAWIYSTKQQQQQYRKLGTISIYTHITPDTHNASLRLIEHLDKADIIFTNQVDKMHTFMLAIGKKMRWAQFQQKQQKVNNNNDGSSSQLVNSNSNNYSLTNIKAKTQQTSTLQFDTDIQISKYIQLQKQIKKDQENQSQINQNIVKKSKQLRKYMVLKQMQKNLKEIKDRQGYAVIFGVDQLKGREQLAVEVQKLYKDGFNVVYAFHQEGQESWHCTSVLKILQENNLPYEILPSTSKLIEAIVGSGLPADRFAIEILPQTSKIEQILGRRKNMAITTALQVRKQELESAVRAVMGVFGKQHVVYLHCVDQMKKDSYFRGEVYQLQSIISNIAPAQSTHQKQKQQQKQPSSLSNSLSKLPSSSYLYIILSPYIPQFNSALQSELRKQSHIRGELQSQQINIVEMELLVRQLEKQGHKDNLQIVNIQLMAGEMLSRINDANVVEQCIAKMFKSKSKEFVKGVVQRAAKNIVVDHIGVSTNMNANAHVNANVNGKKDKTEQRNKKQNQNKSEVQSQKQKQKQKQKEQTQKKQHKSG